MKKNDQLLKINLKTLLKTFEAKYEGLYEQTLHVDDYPARIQQGDIFISQHPEFVREFNHLRKDILSSDREVAAFALALEDMGVEVA